MRQRDRIAMAEEYSEGYEYDEYEGGEGQGNPEDVEESYNEYGEGEGNGEGEGEGEGEDLDVPPPPPPEPPRVFLNNVDNYQGKEITKVLAEVGAPSHRELTW